MASSSNGGGSTVSFGSTPQAKDDLLTAASTGLTEDSSSVAYLDVMANDLGGNAKVLWSLDNGVNNTGAMGGNIAVLGGSPNGVALGPDGHAYVCNSGGYDFVKVEHGLRPGPWPTDFEPERKVFLSRPKLDGLWVRLRYADSETIEGVVPTLLDLPPGCRFAPRCPHQQAQCKVGEIVLEAVDVNHASRCMRVNELYS